MSNSSAPMAAASYFDAFKTKTLHKKVAAAGRLLAKCCVCPRRCGVDRRKDERGFCRTGKNALVCSAFAHLGEEPPISGTRGSGTIFFSRCNLRCLYCQNYDFSQLEEGRETSTREIADHMLRLQEEGCHNINFVTPTHVLPQILEALLIATQEGLRLPLVYNTSGYELVEVLRLLDGIIDIYLPDMRYADEETALKYSQAPDYPAINQAALREMFRQVGPARMNKEDLVTRGLIIRHLVLPKGLSGSEKIFSFIAEELNPDVPVSLMSQYFPAYLADNHPPLNRRLTLEEYEEAVALLKKYGLREGWIQEAGGLQRFAGTHIKRNI